MDHTPPDADASQSSLEGLSLEDKAARLFWVTVHGDGGDVEHDANREAFGVATPAEVIRTHRPGGVVLFAWAGNTEHPDQVSRLTRDLGAAAATYGARLGVAIDEEGGRVTRFEPPAMGFPSARAVAAAQDDDLALRRWRAAGTELARMGITTNLAPVVDLGNTTNPVLGDRTFAEDPLTVAHHAALAIRGLGQGGVASVAKHFPGHGATGVDSHAALPVVDLERPELDAHLEAFSRLLAAEPPAGMMTAHLLVRALDPIRAATCSPAVLTDLLRTELGYGGAVVTDSLSMAGIRTGPGDAEVAVAALAAGADVLLTPPDLSSAVAAICRAVQAGHLDEARIDRALRRALPLVRPAGATSTASGDRGPEARHAVSRAIARRATEVTADPGDLLPLGPAPLVVAGAARSGARGLADELRARDRHVALFEFDVGDTSTGQLAAAGQGQARPATERQVGQTTPGQPAPDAASAALLPTITAGSVLILVRRVPEVDGASQEGLLEVLARHHDAVVLVETGTAAASWSIDTALTIVHTRDAAPVAIEAAATALTATDRLR